MPSTLWWRSPSRLIPGFSLRRKPKCHLRALSRDGSPTARYWIRHHISCDSGEPRPWGWGASFCPWKGRRWAIACTVVVRGLGGGHGHEAIVENLIRRFARVFLLALCLFRLAFRKRLCIKKLRSLWDSTKRHFVRNVKCGKDSELIGLPSVSDRKDEVRLASLFLANLERLVHAQGCVTARHRLLLLLLCDFL